LLGGEWSGDEVTEGLHGGGGEFFGEVYGFELGGNLVIGFAGSLEVGEQEAELVNGEGAGGGPCGNGQDEK
jgi:hypothetical protein